MFWVWLILPNKLLFFSGKLYNIGGYKQLIQSLESIAQKMTIPGVVVNFMKHGPDPDGKLVWFYVVVVLFGVIIVFYHLLNDTFSVSL